ncbi:hypothetical protein D3C78_1075040 [compost metagenome]
MLKRELHFGQRRNWYVRRHHPVENPVATHVGVGQHVVANGLRLTQAAAVTDHQPAVRAQHGQVVGDVLGVGRADTDVDQGHAVAIAGDQVIGRHLVAVPDHPGGNRRGFAVIHALFDDHVARQHHAHETRIAAQLLQAMDDELIDVAVIVGQQDPRLHVPPVAAGVMHQPAQGKIHPGGIEQGQRQWIGVFPIVQTVGNAIGRRRQVGTREHPRQHGGGDTGTGQLIALLDHIRIRDVLLADTDFHGHGEVVHQRNELFQQVFTESRRMGDGDAVGARQLNLGVCASGLRDFALAVVGQAQFGIAEHRALFGIGLDAILEVALERLAQRGGCTIVQECKPIHGLLGGLNDNKSFGHDQHPVF